MPTCSIRPARMQMMRSAMVVASIWSWVTRIVVTPSFSCSDLISVRMVRRSVASRLESGSSRSRSCGSLTRARASATRCCWPPDSSLGTPVEQLADLDEIGGRLDAATPPRRAPTFLKRSGKQDVVAHRHVRIERVGLEDDADVAVARLDLVDDVAVEAAARRRSAGRCRRA